MRSVILLPAIFSFTMTVCVAQNLVPNPSFEFSTACPGGYSQRPGEFRIKEWRSPNAGTPDYFHACSVGEADVPHNWAGVSDAHEGEGYIGLYAWMATGRNYREYVQCRLTNALIRDTLYVVEFYFKLASNSKYAIDRFGILMSDSAVAFRGDRAPNITPTFHALKDSALTEDTGTWEKGRWEFRAKGGEQFLTIGNFDDDFRTRHYLIRFRNVEEEMLKESAYYYVDDVHVRPVYSEEKNVLPVFTYEHVALNTTYVLRNIQFEFNSYKLISTSFDELDDLARYILKNQHIRIQLRGHTDDIGGDRYNLKLSQNRAKSVEKYLALQGIAADRIETSGYGKSRPLIPSATDEARKINRRVEIRFIE